MNCPVTGEKVCKCGVKGVFRLLFTDHAVYTRAVIENSLSNSPATKVNVDRLLRNQDDIGNGLGQYTNNEIGNKMTELLREHIEFANAVLVNLKANKPIDQSVQNALENSTKVAKFISSLDPNIFNEATIKKEFDQHNQHVVELAKLYHTKKYDEFINLFDTYFKHMMGFSDLLSAGLEQKLNTVQQQAGGRRRKGSKRGSKRGSRKGSKKGSKRWN